jgi:hypothetical protein
MQLFDNGICEAIIWFIEPNTQEGQCRNNILGSNSENSCAHVCRCDIVRALLNSGADTELYALAASGQDNNTLWKDLLVSACSQSEEPYLKVSSFINALINNYSSFYILKDDVIINGSIGTYISCLLFSQILIQKGRVVDCALSLLVADNDRRTVNTLISEQPCSDWLNRILSSLNNLRDYFAPNQKTK